MITTLRAEPKPQKIYRTVLPSVMTLEVENDLGERFIGSAFLAISNDFAVTAWHVVCDARNVWANFASGERVKVTGCIDRDADRDLALLKLEKKFPRRQAALSRELQPVAARAYVIGAPKGYEFSISDGMISQIRRVDGFSQYQVSCPISSGNSGGPLFNDRGEVIGVASWTKIDAQNMSFAVPIRELARLDVSRKPVSWQELAKTGPPPLARRSVESHVSLGSVREEKNGSGGFEELKKTLRGAAGKAVTVVVKEGGKEHRFFFTTPVDAWK